MAAGASERTEGAEASELLSWPVKLCYALGDHTVNVALSSLQFFFGFFLVEVVGLRPTLAGLVPLVGRAVDAFTDPTMGRISDVTRWRAGRRRPYLLIGMLPFGLCYAALWMDPPLASQGAKFAWFTSMYVLLSIALTVLAVPYLALVPEMTRSYNERTSVNTWRAAFAILGTLLAVTTMRPLVEWSGGGAAGWAEAARIYGLWLMLPWGIVWLVTFERPSLGGRSVEPFVRGLRSLFAHRAYQWLTGLYLLSRVALDLTSAMFIFFFTYWLGRPDDFEITMFLFLASVVLALPLWLQVARRLDKRSIFLMGTASWLGACTFMMLVQPSWPRETLFLVAFLAGAGYAAADMIPWSMLGEVVDEDELLTGQRREGVYFGFFTFLRKLGGASGVALGFVALDLAGFEKGAIQEESALRAIRWLTAGVPGLFVVLAGLVAWRYPLTRARHAEVLEALRARRRASGGPEPAPPGAA